MPLRSVLPLSGSLPALIGSSSTSLVPGSGGSRDIFGWAEKAIFRERDARISELENERTEQLASLADTQARASEARDRSERGSEQACLPQRRRSSSAPAARLGLCRRGLLRSRQIKPA